MDDRVDALNAKMLLAFGEAIPFMQVQYPINAAMLAKLEKAVNDSIAAGKNLLGEDKYYGYNRLIKDGCLF